ncbi:MAG: L,D-transpeptidase [Pseudomonadota bacterium]
MYFRVPVRSFALSLSLCFCTSAFAMPELDAQHVAALSNTAALGQGSLSSAPQAKPKPLAPTLHAHIDLTAQRMTIKTAGQTLHSWAISSGRTGHETPTGTFTPAWKAKMWHSRKYHMSPMPYSVFFNGGIATHGTNAVKRLGHPASHGCIRLTTPNARKFYQLVQRHGMKRTRIVVTGFAKQGTYRVAQASSGAVSTPVAIRRKPRSRNTYGTPQVGFSIMTADR